MVRSSEISDPYNIADFNKYFATVTSTSVTSTNVISCLSQISSFEIWKTICSSTDSLSHNVDGLSNQIVRNIAWNVTDILDVFPDKLKCAIVRKVIQMI